LIGVASMFAVIGLKIAVRIPIVIVMSPTRIQLDESNASFDHAPSE
jgi:hypothetical protein